ncbi:hypothetical protein F0U61_16950 [Archangium violaceum]|uniref:hypothetical protein n=1 Tax=Archangium violaceum TaxID=83451 RepID=UPI002B2CEB08|nr:hypothetical protein F0U61_16950 [Archangium violaceum]
MMRRVGREKGRAVLVFAAVALLVLPLVGLVILWSRAPPERVVDGWRFVPWVPPGEARERPTLLQPCLGDEQCDPPFVCFHDPRYQQRRCTATDCESDSWCPTQTACRSIPMRGRQRMALRACALEGTRKEGERCLRFPQAALREWACGEGLVCAGSGWCGRRCVPGQEGTCPEGFFCARGDPDGPVCQPTCEGRACPEGQECLRQEGGASVCLKVQGRSCQDEEPCSDGEVCETEPFLSLKGQAWGSCVQTCGHEGAASCPEDSVCFHGRCRLRCSLLRPYPCGTRFCVSTDDEGNGVCLSSPEQWDMNAEHR